MNKLEEEEEVRKLNTTQNKTKETTNFDHTKANNQPQENSKNVNAASSMNKTDQKNIDLLEVIALWKKP